MPKLKRAWLGAAGPLGEIAILQCWDAATRRRAIRSLVSIGGRGFVRLILAGVVRPQSFPPAGRCAHATCRRLAGQLIAGSRAVIFPHSPRRRCARAETRALVRRPEEKVPHELVGRLTARLPAPFSFLTAPTGRLAGPRGWRPTPRASRRRARRCVARFA